MGNKNGKKISWSVVNVDFVAPIVLLASLHLETRGNEIGTISLEHSCVHALAQTKLPPPNWHGSRQHLHWKPNVKEQGRQKIVYAILKQCVTQSGPAGFI